MTASEIANELNISDSSVIRLVRALGYSGYTDFQKDVQQRLRERIKNEHKELAPAVKIKKTVIDGDRDTIVAQVYNKAIENLNYTYSKIDAKALEEVANIIIQSKNKYLAGFRGSASHVYFLGQKMRNVVDNVYFLTVGDSSLIERIVDIRPEDCLVLFSFTRSTKIGLDALEIAAQKGAKIVVVTDKLTTPHVKKANVVLQAKVEGVSFSNSYVSSMFLCDLLIAILSHKIDRSKRGKWDLIEEYLDKNNITF